MVPIEKEILKILIEKFRKLCSVKYGLHVFSLHESFNLVWGTAEGGTFKEIYGRITIEGFYILFKYYPEKLDSYIVDTIVDKKFPSAMKFFPVLHPGDRDEEIADLGNKIQAVCDRYNLCPLLSRTYGCYGVFRKLESNFTEVVRVGDPVCTIKFTDSCNWTESDVESMIVEELCLKWPDI